MNPLFYPQYLSLLSRYIHLSYPYPFLTHISNFLKRNQNVSFFISPAASVRGCNECHIGPWRVVLGVGCLSFLVSLPYFPGLEFLVLPPFLLHFPLVGLKRT